ncbi:MAG: hypothetical protein ACI9KS_001196 [Sulfitobacter sp.]|jgi:hypothetical protein
MMNSVIYRFAHSESGAVTVDWVVLTAAMVGLGIGALGVVQVGMADLSNDLADELKKDRGIFQQGFGIALTNASFEDIEGMLAAGWGFYAFNDGMAGWEELDALRFEVVHSRYNGVDAAHGGFSLDMDASPGNLTIAQTLDDAIDGSFYNVSFSAADPVGNNGVDVFFGGEKVGTVEPGGNDMERFSFEIEGGSGDGDNKLELRGTGPQDNTGAYIDNIEVK